ncbi:MAG TPA: hypothetical protein VFW87_14490 [Pirellulales bacterium]|nr:hypothetical protein [Pirellulales bacterium]
MNDSVDGNLAGLDLVAAAHRREEWTVQLSYPQAMVPRHAESFCSWARRLRGKLIDARPAADLKDDQSVVVIEQFEFRNQEDAAEFCRYTCQALEKWSGACTERRYTMKLRGRIKFDGKHEGRVGSARARSSETD